MNEELELILDSAEQQMQSTIKHLDKTFSNIRAGRANAQMLGGVYVDYYGTNTALSQVANISVPDSRTIVVQPWEKKMVAAIEKAILVANIGFNPSNNGEQVIINVPPLTEERRKELSKQAKSEAEDAKVGVRNARAEANKEIKKTESSDDMKKDAEERVQKLTAKKKKKKKKKN